MALLGGGGGHGGLSGDSPAELRHGSGLGRPPCVHACVGNVDTEGY
jgi:hypothetical protein